MDGIYLVNKEKNCTSFDVVYQCKKICNQKSVGHTGTLDPNATGVLVVLLGKACKCLPYLSNDTKEYVATMKLGEKTDTGDCWGKVIETKAVKDFSTQKIQQVLDSFLGESLQIPPMVSAIKINGKKCYEYAREGIEVKREPRKITIHQIELLKLEKEIKFRCVVSAGTYIRTLCEDIAEKLETVGCMTSLIRTKVGNFDIHMCNTVEEIKQQQATLYSVTELLKMRYPYIEVDDCKDIMDGKKVRMKMDEPLILALYQGKALAMMEKVENQVYKTKRGLW